MKVLALKPGHDGAIAYVEDGALVFSLEPEKDSAPRHNAMQPEQLVAALQMVPCCPDVVAVGGWHDRTPGQFGSIAQGYFGLGRPSSVIGTILGNEVRLFSSSHERSHIFGGVAMSHFDPAEDIAILVWEGQIGAFYRWSREGRSIRCFPVLGQPGARYAALFALADKSFADKGMVPRTEDAGKLMALAGRSDGDRPAPDSIDVVESLLSCRSLYPFDKGAYRSSRLYNCTVEHPEVARTARFLSDRMFGIFRDAAESLFPQPLPLVIGGGCALNCEWNTSWRRSGIFADVFVPPCPDDSGSAIGTAVDAAFFYGDGVGLTWTVYSGPGFVWDTQAPDHWSATTLDHAQLSRVLERGEVVAWVQGRCEIGPRALGHRSLLASATEARTRAELNRIKDREDYRPIAPACLEQDLSVWFDDATPDPYMLYFRSVKDPTALPSIRHTDGSARVQSVGATSGSSLFELLTVHRERTGVGVLCNTSLNFSGMGFINRTSDVFAFAERKGVSNVVIDDVHYSNESSEVVSTHNN